MTLQDSLKEILKSLNNKFIKTEKKIEKVEMDTAANLENLAENKADIKYVDGKFAVYSQGGDVADRTKTQPPKDLQESAFVALSTRKYNRIGLNEAPIGSAFYVKEGDNKVPYIYCGEPTGEDNNCALLARAYPLEEKITYSNDLHDEGYIGSSIEKICNELGETLSYLDDKSICFFDTCYSDSPGDEYPDGYFSYERIGRFCFPIDTYTSLASPFDALAIYYDVKPRYSSEDPFNNVIDAVGISRYDYIWTAGDSDTTIETLEWGYQTHMSYDRESIEGIEGLVWPCIAVDKDAFISEDKFIIEDLEVAPETREYNYLLNMGDGRFKNIGEDLKNQFKEDYSKIFLPCTIIDFGGEELLETQRGVNGTNSDTYKKIVASNYVAILKNFYTTEANQITDRTVLVNFNEYSSGKLKGLCNTYDSDGQLIQLEIHINSLGRVKYNLYEPQ